MKSDYIETVWQLATYDVWGNAKDGYEVNDVYRGRTVKLRLLVITANPGTPQEFVHASPMPGTIRRLFGTGRTRIETDGDDVHIMVNRKRDGYPVGEMTCTSHSSLSPIREKVV